MGSHKKKKCIRGHVLRKDTVYIRSNGFRECKRCIVIRMREWRKKNG